MTATDPKAAAKKAGDDKAKPVAAKTSEPAKSSSTRLAVLRP